MSENGWNKYQVFVTSELKRMNLKLIEIEKNVCLSSSQLAKLEVKSGIWGLMGGLIPVAVYLVIRTMLNS